METISISIAGSSNKNAAHRSLHNALNNNQYIKENAQLTLPDSPPEGMGSELEVIQLVLSVGFDLAMLVLALSEWRRDSRATATPITVRARGRTTDLSLDDMADDDRHYVVRRALAGAPDPRRSRCILIGVSDYVNLPPLPGVQQNIVQLEKALVDPEIWGIPPDRIKTIGYSEQSAEEIKKAISVAGEDDPDTLLVYFAGHGLPDKNNGLLLALPEATRENEAKTVPWQQLAKVISDADSHRRVVWLDCCHAGLALPGKEAQPDRKDSPEMLEVPTVDRTYVLAAAQKNETATSPDGEACTAFTGELVNVLRDGIAPGPPEREFLSLNDLHQQVRSALTKSGLSDPIRHDPNNIGQLPHFHNNNKNVTRRRTRRTGGPIRLPRARRTDPTPAGEESPSVFRQSGVMWSGLAVFSVLALTLLWLLGPPLITSPVSGLSLTKYCSEIGSKGGGSQGFTVAGGPDCVHQINLNEACEFQYGESGLEARPTSSDAYSNVCYSPITNVTYDAGISDMTGYCKSLTTVDDVIATATSPGYGDTWICKSPIDLDLACEAQNKQGDLVARKEADGGLTCHKILF